MSYRIRRHFVTLNEQGRTSFTEAFSVYARPRGGQFGVGAGMGDIAAFLRPRISQIRNDPELQELLLLASERESAILFENPGTRQQYDDFLSKEGE